MVKAIHRRAYVNPLPGYSEKEQRTAIVAAFGEPDEWYVESRNVTRTNFIEHLRAGDIAVVARMGCLAKIAKRIDTRISDFLEARGDIHAKGCTIEDAVGCTSKTWDCYKAAAKSFLLAQRSIKNGSARKLNFTNAEIKTMIRIQESRRYKNDNQRRVAIEREGIKPVPGRTWLIQVLPAIARQRGLEL